MTSRYLIKTERTFSAVRKTAWVVTLAVALGGQFYAPLGLLVPFIMLALFSMSLFKGRYWCGNFCPHGSFFDYLLLPLSRNNKIPGFLKSRAFISFFFLFFMFNFTRRFVFLFRNIGSGSLLYSAGMIFSNTYLMVLLAGGLLAVWINPRTWCQFCPMGSIQTLSYKLGKALGLTGGDVKVTAEHPDLCHSCGKCARVCPMHLAPYREFREEKNQVEDERCIRCNTCVNNCPAGILHLADAGRALSLKEGVDLGGFETAAHYGGRIVKIKELKKDIREYRIRLDAPARMELMPGQFILLKIDEREDLYRAYTISSANGEGTEIGITVKRVEDGYGTQILFEKFKEGDRVEVKGPLGRDLRIDPSKNKLIFVANGIGITPFAAAAWSLLENPGAYGFQGDITLLYGARYEEDLIYDDLFARLDRQHANFRYFKTLSRDEKSPVRKGYVTNILQEIELDAGTTVYICGTRNMADDVIRILVEKGIPEDSIHYEDFAA